MNESRSNADSLAPFGKGVLSYDDLPEQLNLASWFVDSHLHAGRGQRTALITDEGTTTYDELADLVNRVGNVLRRLGIEQGQRVLLALSDGVEFVATWYGAQKIGAVTAEVYTYLHPKDFAYYLNYTEARVVIADRTTLDAMREANASQILAVGVSPDELHPGEHSLEALIDEVPAVLEAAPTTRDDIAIWKFTTGSTGNPKACVHPTRSSVLSFDSYARGVLEITADDRVLAIPKLFFGYARDLVALYPFGVGGSGIVFPERTTPERIFELIARHRPTILVNVPTMMSAMVGHPDAGEQDLSCLRLCTSAGEALPAELHRKWDKAFGVDVVDGIGSSEAYHIYISNRPGRGRQSSVGQVVPGYSARVVGEDGVEMADGEVGVLEVTGETVALEYYGAPDKTAETFAGDTVRTGDLFIRDAEGFFSYRGRADDLLKVGGIWVAPSEVEHFLIGHADVQECAVVGHERHGLIRPRAYVVRRPNARVRAHDLIDFARDGLSPHKRPRDVVFVNELPRTANGKLDRTALKELDEAGSPTSGRDEESP